TWTIGASHTPAAFLAIAGTALPFDVTDVVASMLFGLAFAPELARLLARVRVRMQVQWEPAAQPPSVGPGPVRAGPQIGRALPLEYLRAHAAAIGGLGDVERTVLAVRACGGSPYAFAGRNLVAGVLAGRSGDRSFGRQVNLTSFAIFSLRAAGHSPRFRPVRNA